MRILIDLGDAVESEPGLRGGNPCLPGTRFPVSRILAELADSRFVEEMAEDYDLDDDQILAFLRALARGLEYPTGVEC